MSAMELDEQPEDATMAVAGAASSKKAKLEAKALARPWVEKYRPSSLDELVAHKDIISVLRRLIEADKLPHTLLYGPPGTGKTMMAKAVANSTTASFISVVGSEFVQKYLGEGPRMVRDVFRLARENAPAIIFIDEIDAIATKRFDAQTGADREVQRILLELLNQMDGFDQSTNVKVIMATNRADTLDPALLRPGRLDRKIEFPAPDRRQKRLVFQACTANMNLSDTVDLEDYVSRPERVSAADCSAIANEAGLHAVRENRYVVMPKDLDAAYKKHVNKADTDFAFYTH
mmetsp:Transcript_30333/g.99313  ORF Transcript_30333/g.99313 Transcript_30333/m.99313 type:complete len:289 (-) Transcript_30333:58-924(-)